MKRILIIIALLCAALAGCQPRYRLGCLPSEVDWQTVAIAETPALALPAIVDMRTAFTPRDQGAQSSCVGFTVAAAVGAHAGAWCSPAFIYNQRTTSNCKRDAGMSLYNGLRLATGTGDCLETNMPYNAGNTCSQPDAAAMTDAASRRASGYAVLWGQQGAANLDALRAQLAAGRPVLGAFPVYRSFYQNAAGTIPPHTEGETFYGGHAMLLVGYDADGFWALNSWGPTWGHGGFAYLSNAFVQADAWEGWIITGLVGASSYSAYVHGECVDEDTGAYLAGVTVRLGTRSSTTNAKGQWGQTFTLTPGQSYTLEVDAPAGYWLPGGAQFTAPITPTTILAVPPFCFRWMATATPKPTATRTKTPTVTPTCTEVYPTPTATVPMPPTIGPTPTKCVSAYQQFSWRERQTIIATAYTLIGRGLEEGLDMMTDPTLAIGNAQRMLAPLTRVYIVTGDQGERIMCRGFAFAIICQRENDPCGGEFGAVDWGGPMMTLVGGIWGVEP